MKTLIVYATKYGTTQMLAKNLAHEVDTRPVFLPIKQVNHTMLNDTDIVIIGSPVYAGQLPKNMKKWLSHHHD